MRGWLGARRRPAARCGARFRRRRRARADAPAVGELALPALARGVPALAEQVLRTLCWHLDPSSSGSRGPPAVAIAASATGLPRRVAAREGGWEEALALMQDLGDLAEPALGRAARPAQLAQWRGRSARPWLAHRPLVELIRASAAPPSSRAAARAARAPLVSDTAAARRAWRRLPDAPGELMGIRHSDRLERMLGSGGHADPPPGAAKLWRARLAEAGCSPTRARRADRRVPDPPGRARRRRSPAAARSAGP